MNPMGESPGTQDPDDLSSDLNDSADDGDATSADAGQTAAGGETIQSVGSGPVRGVTLGHDGAKGG